MQGVIFFILFSTACPVLGQAMEKKDLTPKDYHLWHRMFDPKISDDGKWVSFLLSYENAEDTLMLQRTADKTLIPFPGGSDYHFFGNYFVYKRNSTLNIFNTQNRETQRIDEVQKYGITPDNKYIISLSVKGIDGKVLGRNLKIQRLGTNNDINLEYIEDFEISESGDLLAFIAQNENMWNLKVLDLKTPQNAKTLLASSKPLEGIVWSTKRSLAILESAMEGKKILWFSDVLQNSIPIVFNGKKSTHLESDLVFFDNPSNTLKFSKDGEKLFFQVVERKILDSFDDTEGGVQVWNAKDKHIYPTYNGNKDFFRKPPIMGCWSLSNNSLQLLGDYKSSSAIITEGEYVYTQRLLDDEISNAPIYVNNVESGTMKLVLFKTPKMQMKASLSGKYLFYFDNNDWWVYDAEKESHNNITENINSDFTDREFDLSGVVPPYGFVGLTEGERSALIYDKYDMWEISIDGSGVERITKGRESGKVFRFVNTEEEVSFSKPNLASNISLKNGVVLKMEDSSRGTCYYFLNKNRKLHPLSPSGSLVALIKRAKNVDVFIYTIERFDLSPQLFLSKKDEGTTLFSSNIQQKNYNWGRANLVKYDLPSGECLQGALFYPAGFELEKQYPMVVFVYEKMSQVLHNYQNPTLLTGADINITNLTTRGYFVFCPDIIFTPNQLGESALTCVEAGVAEVLKKVPVKKDRIGIFGHSFGGYEVSYIIGNTNTFATAISASGIHDLKSFYFSTAWLWNIPQAGRFTNGQFRFNKPFFQQPELYLKNSPMEYVTHIQTPLLTITGGLDTNINWEQSVEMYHALRLLGKEHIMLIYPQEGHDFFGIQNQIDMTYKRWQWFDHYLKEEPIFEWMLPEP